MVARTGHCTLLEFRGPMVEWGRRHSIRHSWRIAGLDDPERGLSPLACLPGQAMEAGDS